MNFSWRRARSIAVGTLGLLGMLGGVAHAEDVGLIISTSGDVKVKSPSRTKLVAASAFLGLPEGSRLTLGGNGNAVVVFFKDGSRFRAAPGSVVSASAAGYQLVSGPALKPMPPLKLLQAKLLQSSRVAAGRPAAVTVRTGLVPLELQSLSHTATLAERPTFAWTGAKGVTTYKIRLRDDNDQLIWGPEVEGTSIAYPATAPALKPGEEYVWEVTAMAGGNLYKAEGVFSVLEPEKRQAVQTELADLQGIDDSAISDALRAEIYARNDLWDDAIPVYKRLLQANPNSGTLLLNLADITAEQGQFAESARYRDLAKAAEG